MRKLIQIDRKKMKVYGYQGAPLRQILMLNLSSEEMIILLNFFSHKPDWTIGSKGISERNFYREKNQKRVNKIVGKLKSMGYMSETETAYIMNLDKIEDDYIKNSNEVTQSNPIDKLEKRVKKLSNEVTQSNPQEVTQSNPQEVTQSNPNNINNNGQASAPKGAEAVLNNKTNGVKLDVGGCSASSGFSFGNPNPLHPPTEVNKNGNDLQFILDNSSTFSYTYENQNWKAIDLTSYSNENIAYAVSQRIQNTPIETIPKNVYTLLTFMVRFSQHIPNSNLWNVFLNQINNNTKLIDALNRL